MLGTTRFVTAASTFERNSHPNAAGCQPAERLLNVVVHRGCSQTKLHFRQSGAIAGGDGSRRQPGRLTDLLKGEAAIGFQFHDFPQVIRQPQQCGGYRLGPLSAPLSVVG